MKDFLLQTLSNGYYFIAISIFYYIATLHQVDILFRLQPKILSDQNVGKQPFDKEYDIGFTKQLFTNFHLHLLGLRHIFLHREKDWPVVTGNKKIKLRLAVIIGLKQFLAPYLIVGIIWFYIKYQIDQKFAYNSLQITLGEIQDYLFWIESSDIAKYVLKNTSLLMLVWGLICVLFIIVDSVFSFLDKLKLPIKFAFTLLLIAANISFFGAATGTRLEHENRKLKQLEAVIENVHNDIYVHAAQNVLAQDFKDTIDRIFIEYSDAIAEVKNETSEELQTVGFVPSIKSDIEQSLWNVWQNSKNDYSFEYIINRLPQTHPFHFDLNDDEETVFSKEEVSKRFDVDPKSFTFYASTDFSASEKKTSDVIIGLIDKHHSKRTTYDSYILDKTKWNIEKGYTIQQHILDQSRKNTSKQGQYINRILSTVFEYLIDIGLDQFKVIAENSLLKEFFALNLTEGYSENICSRIVAYIDNVLVSKTGAQIQRPHVARSEIKTPVKTRFRKIARDLIAVAKIKNSEYIKMEKLRQAELALKERKASKKLASLKSKSRWERLRQRFAIRAARNSNVKVDAQFPFSTSQAQEFVDILNDWDNYCEQSKIYWLDRTNLEDCFYDFINNNPMRIAAWGFIIQQEDAYAFIEYYRNRPFQSTYTPLGYKLNPDSWDGSGKPYYTLYYYFNSVGRSDFDYVEEDVDDGVAFFCPPHR